METGCAFLEGIQAWGRVRGEPKRHQAARKRIEVFGVRRVWNPILVTGCVTLGSHLASLKLSFFIHKSG